MKTVRLLPLLMFLVAGCATPYQPDGFTGGYSDTQLTPDVLQAHFRGNGYTFCERVHDFAVLRAADRCLQNGYPYFASVDDRNGTSTSVINTPRYAYKTGSAYAYGNSASITAIPFTHLARLSSSTSRKQFAD